MSNPKKLAELTAIVYYLSELQKLNLITPSIGKSYPDNPVDKEQVLLHNSYRKIQQLRINNIKSEITQLKDVGITICWNTFLDNKNRLRKKIHYLNIKFHPVPFRKLNRRSNNNRKKVKNKKSRERYYARLIKKKFKFYNEHPESRTVVNLSTYNLSMSDVFALELGYGFIPTPNNKEKEEEVLILEGLRFVDRVGKIDSTLDKDNGTPNNFVATNDTHNINAVGTYSGITANLSQAEQVSEMFIKDKTVPKNLQYSQPKEPQPTHNVTKTLIKEFTELNSRLINGIRSGSRRRFNLPKVVQESLVNLKKLVRDKRLDIRKVDKGQTILVIDYEQRKKAEELNIATISTICEDQVSNWNHNKSFIENKMKHLHEHKFITSIELAAVTGILVGGKCGKLKNKDGTIKYTRAIDSNELFVRQSTPYVYPLFKVHKMPFCDVLNVEPTDVATVIPSRLVVGMSSCQMYRIQSWLEHFLTPLAKCYGSFEYIKDSNDMLAEIENVKLISQNENWDWDNVTIFTIDVKALYPSIKFEHMKKALLKCFHDCTIWSNEIINILIEVIIYTLNNQQIIWNNQYYLLSQGIPTGAKHSVPLANLFLTFIMFELLNSDNEFKSMFDGSVKLWKRFIDDCGGIFLGNIDQFLDYFNMLNNHFHKFSLELTCDTDTHTVVDGENIVEKDEKIISFLDIEIFKAEGTIHTREYRKETSATSYLKYQSSHPRHTFPGIIKSQLYRLRRLCSREVDFEKAVSDLKARCLKSGYPSSMVNNILGNAPNITRTVSRNLGIVEENSEQPHIARLVVLSGTSYEKEFSNFASKMNALIGPRIKVEIVKSTTMSISRLLFNNCDYESGKKDCDTPNCIICCNGMNKDNTLITSTVSKKSYKVNRNLNCSNAGIYVITGGCQEQYTGKTTGNFLNRADEHFRKTRTSSVFLHQQKCDKCSDLKDCSIAFVEDYLGRGKYSLSEREHLWNFRVKGTLNIRKTLKS